MFEAVEPLRLLIYELSSTQRHMLHQMLTETVDRPFARADAALYVSKAAGRNLVTVADAA